MRCPVKRRILGTFVSAPCTGTPKQRRDGLDLLGQTSEFAEHLHLFPSYLLRKGVQTS
jgi:hypothetical protein